MIVTFIQDENIHFESGREMKSRWSRSNHFSCHPLWIAFSAGFVTVECACLVARACPPLPLVEKAVSACRMALACEERLVPPSVPQNRPRCRSTRVPGKVQGELCSGAFCCACKTPQRAPPVSGRSRWSAHTGFAAACVQKNGGKRATNGQGPDAHGRDSGLFGATLHARSLVN